MPARRSFLHWLTGVPVAAGVSAESAQAAPPRDYLRELGVSPVINAAGMYTMFTGSLMHPDSVEAWAAASKSYCRLDELHDAVGRRIAELIGCESAMVPSGAAAALALGTTACITGTDPAKILRFPEIPGMKNEVLIQKAHRFPYDHSVRACGVRLIEVETASELERAINPRTALLLFLNKADPAGSIKRAEFVALGKKHSVPTFNDAAADVPPVENLFAYTRMGFDLVAFSGGKGIRGPQSAGLLLGRRDLIQAARMNTAPNSDTFGRGFKVNKEEMIAMLVALERYLKRDHASDWREWERRAKMIAASAARVPGITSEVFVPTIANQVPHVRVHFGSAAKVTPGEALRRLRTGSPQIEPVPAPEVKGTLEFASWTLERGEAEIVARRLGEVLS